MSEYGWAERWCRLLLRRRWLAVLAGGAVLVCGVSAARQLGLRVSMTDYYPAGHPHIRLYQDFPEMLQMTNAVVVLVSVRDGDLYNSETLGKIHRLTVGLLETRGVNPHAVVSLTHSRLNDIKIRDGMINILPVVRTPTQPQSPQELAQIKNAVYTNLGIRGVYVSEDNKTALIRAGFWDAEVNARDVFSRLRRLAAQEQDANTAVAFAGNIVLAAMGTVVLPASLAIRADAAPASEGWDGLDYALVALAAVSLGTALVWLFSPLRLQTEMGLYLLVLSLVNSLLPFSLRALVSSGESAQTPEPTA